MKFLSSMDFKVYYHKNIFNVFILGICSGLPLTLSASTLHTWLASENISLVHIGLIGLVGLPYTLKFLWSPVIDLYFFKSVGKRKFWMLLTQFSMFTIIGIISIFEPKDSLFLFAILALALSFSSATFDIAYDAYRTDILSDNQKGAGAAISVFGYRLGMIISGGFALIIAGIYDFSFAYLSMSFILIFFFIFTIFINEPYQDNLENRNLIKFVIAAFKNLSQKYKNLIALVLFIIFFKIGDAFAGSLLNVFLLKGLNLSLVEIGSLNKIISIVSTIIGAFVGGIILSKINIYKSLLIFGVLQALSNLLFIPLSMFEIQNLIIIFFTITIENFCSGMGTAAFVALIMQICNKDYSATQFALLSALSSVGRVLLMPYTGYTAEYFGWDFFFLISFFVSVPGILLIRKIQI